RRHRHDVAAIVGALRGAGVLLYVGDLGAADVGEVDGHAVARVDLPERPNGEQLHGITAPWHEIGIAFDRIDRARAHDRVALDVLVARRVARRPLPRRERDLLRA